MRKGEVMTLLDRSNMDWWYVKNHKGKTGYVPRNFVALQACILFIFSRILHYLVLLENDRK